VKRLKFFGGLFSTMRQGTVPDPLSDSRIACNLVGILIVDKPEGISSSAVVARVKRLLKVNKIGHCGTLDPFATGVLVLCLNQATRIADQLLDQDKIYRFTMKLGQETDTLDCTGEITGTFSGTPSSRNDFEAAIAQFRGSFTQQVPRFSAIKIGGRRLYELTRKGVHVEPPSRAVCVRRLELLSFDWPNAVLDVHCSKGTYVRKLASDIGNALGCGAHVTHLIRLASGPFRIEQAITLEELSASFDACEWQSKVIPMNQTLGHLPAISIMDERILNGLRNGQMDPSLEAECRDRSQGMEGPLRLVSGEDDLVALWWHRSGPEGQRRLRVLQ
jgi:tRNA pseudouridine55 synthase